MGQGLSVHRVFLTLPEEIALVAEGLGHMSRNAASASRSINQPQPRVASNATSNAWSTTPKSWRRASSPVLHNRRVAKLEIGREEQILQEALRLFSQAGYHGTSLQEIADELGITRPAFYYYFNSKDELLWRLIGNLGDQLLEESRPIVATDASPSQKMRDLLVAHTLTILGNRDAFKIYFTERHLVGTRRDRQLRRGEEQYHRLFENVIRDGQAEGMFRDDNANVLALLVTGLANSALQWFQPRRDLSLDDISELVADLGLAAIAPARPPEGRSTPVRARAVRLNGKPVAARAAAAPTRAAINPQRPRRRRRVE